MTPTYHHALPNGTKVGSYEIQSVLGTGGFAITYKAYDCTLDRLVAIKEYLPSGLAVRTADGTTVVPKSQGDTQDYHYGLKRFLDEARTLDKFHEPGIVRVINYMEAYGTAYFVMDYEEGESLDARLKAEITLPEDEIRAVLAPILRGLRAVHRQNFLHRDIKPLNIYLRRDGTPVLLDFGAARLALGEHSRAMTRMVTPGYAPFEQYLADGKQGPWSDIYGIGATMYHCATGLAPVAATERVAALHDGEPDPVRQLADTLKRKYSGEFVDVMMWMLEPVAKDRPQSVDAALTAFAGGAAIPRAPGFSAAGLRETLNLGDGADAPAAAWPAETLQAIEVRLAQHFGPLSKVLVRKAAAKTGDLDALIELLARFIEDEPARTAFLASTQALSAGEGRLAGAQTRIPRPDGPRSDLDPALLAAAEARLTAYLGPVARVLVKKAAAKTTDPEIFCRMLAEELSDPAERDAFRRALGPR